MDPSGSKAESSSAPARGSQARLVSAVTTIAHSIRDLDIVDHFPGEANALTGVGMQGGRENSTAGGIAPSIATIMGITTGNIRITEIRTMTIAVTAAAIRMTMTMDMATAMDMGID